MKKKLLFFIMIPLILLSGAYYSLALYVLVGSNIEFLLIYCLNPESNRLPTKLAKSYLFNFRGDKDDLDVGCLK